MRLQEFTSPILEACWKGYKQLGMKKKGKRTVPNCVPVKEAANAAQQAAIAIAKKKKKGLKEGLGVIDMSKLSVRIKAMLDKGMSEQQITQQLVNEGIPLRLIQQAMVVAGQ